MTRWREATATEDVGSPRAPERRRFSPTWATAVAVFIVVAVGLFDLATPPSAVLKTLPVLGPLFASLASPWRHTGGVAALGFAVALLLGVSDRIWLEEAHLIALGLVALGGVVCTYAAAQREQRVSAMRRLAHVAEVAQQAMLRPPPAVLAHIGLASRYMSASEVARVGGDLYETAFTPYGVRIVIGDVRGKGLDGIRLAARVLAAFRETVCDRSLLDLARTIDKRLSGDTSEEDFVTALFAEFPPDGGMLLVNCGHHPPIRVCRGEPWTLAPAEATLPLGLGPDPRAEQFGLDAGDRVLFFTDGLTEARDGRGAFFPLEDYLDVLLAPSRQQAVDELLQRAVEHAGGDLEDDVAVLVAERLPC